ncbi:MAG: hypothetical protein DME26_12895 [Verrucomicrobia bacterium]|nr:MAG: hypothetical protein DME26_12895 [Verrucomicrobiota bacterium]
MESGSAELYAWCRLNLDWLREAASLVDLAVNMEHESRLIQALPQRAVLTLRLRQDATLVLLALWYGFDTQVREHGATQVALSVEQLNRLLKEKLLPDLKSQPSASRMSEILRLAQRFNLLRADFVPVVNSKCIANSSALMPSTSATSCSMRPWTAKCARRWTTSFACSSSSPTASKPHACSIIGIPTTMTCAYGTLPTRKPRCRAWTNRVAK